LDLQVLDDFPVELSLAKVLAKLKIDERRSQILGADDAFKTGVRLIHPRAFYRAAYVTRHDSEHVEIEATQFTSRVLAKNLEHVGRVFPYVLTIGDLLENKARDSEKIALKLVLEAVGDLALGSALEYLQRHISEQHVFNTTSHMGPGQLDWSIGQQKQLFSILGNVKDAIGVTLTESLMMLPRKSISGIVFPTEVNFASCQLCKKSKCPSRQAPFDKALSEKYGYNQAADVRKPNTLNYYSKGQTTQTGNGLEGSEE
jgi:hypothetical protein